MGTVDFSSWLEKISPRAGLKKISFKNFLISEKSII